MTDIPGQPDQMMKFRHITVPLSQVNVEVEERELPDGKTAKVLVIGPVAFTFQLPLLKEGAEELASLLLSTSGLKVAGADLLERLEKRT